MELKKKSSKIQGAYITEKKKNISTIILGDVKFCSVVEQESRQSISKNIEDPNNTINKLELTDLCNTAGVQVCVEQSLQSSLRYKTRFNKFLVMELN